MKLSWITGIKLTVVCLLGQLGISSTASAVFFPYPPPTFTYLLTSEDYDQYSVVSYINLIAFAEILPHVYTNIPGIFTSSPFNPSLLTPVNIPFTQGEIQNFQAQISAAIDAMYRVVMTITVPPGANRNFVINALAAISQNIAFNNFNGVRTALTALLTQMNYWAVEFSNNQVGAPPLAPPNLLVPPIRSQPTHLQAYLWIYCVYSIAYQIIPGATLSQLISWYSSTQFQKGLRLAIDNIIPMQIFPDSTVHLAFQSYDFVNNAIARGTFTERTLNQVMPPLRQAFWQLTPK
ncbi:MAG: hypothetical protein HY860_04570 [Chlamydiales bacterium]|nr:hypothetical protein [Chlamydiales bacterium]